MLHVMKRAFPRTIPVLAGYIFLGVAYGISMKENGLHAGWSGLISLILYGGSMQFAMVDLLKAAFAPFTIAVLTVLIQARHLFYGLSMLEKYQNVGKSKPYLIFALTDETYSLLCSGAPGGENPERWYLAVSFLDHLYWVTGSVLGGLLGVVIPVSLLTGIDFAMTALFTVIVTEQTMEAVEGFHAGKISCEEVVFSPVLGGGATLAGLLLIGKKDFLLFAMVMIFLGFLVRWFLTERRQQV